jgi:hypothetical protein
VTSVVSAQAVVLGATVVMDPPVPDVSTGARPLRARSCSAPSPSITSRTICVAWATGAGNHGGGADRPG